MKKHTRWLVGLVVVTLLLSSFLAPSTINVKIEISYEEPKTKVEPIMFDATPEVNLSAFPIFSTPQINLDTVTISPEPLEALAIADKQYELPIRAPMESLHKVKTSNTRLEARNAYIDRYKQTAIDEQMRFGIPASISLAQGILESRSGESYLGVNANNHFGIKYWNRKKVPANIRKMLTEKGYLSRHDDCCTKATRNSCSGVDKFCSFDRPWASWRYHSYILIRYKRVKSLIAKENIDYKAWSYAIQKSGYATSKTYAEKLIKLINELELYRYDVID